MFEHSVRRDEVRAVIGSGEVIADYPDDTPFPSCLILGFPDGRALHVVVAIDRVWERCYVVTAYPPDPSRWENDFKTRRSP